MSEAVPDDSCVARARAGDELAFVVLYRWIQPRVVRYLVMLVGRAAEDVAAETWAQVCRDLDRFDGGAPALRAWVVRIARNRALDHLRAERRRPVVSLPGSDLPEPRRAWSAAADEAAEQEATRRALAAIASLPPDQAEAVLLRAVVGLDAAAAAEVLGKRPGAVRTAAHRGLRTLAARVAAARESARDAGCDTPEGLDALEVS